MNKRVGKVKNARNQPRQKLFSELQDFAEQLKAKFSAFAVGEPENQLRAPVENLFSAYGGIISKQIMLKGESTLGRLGKPDFAVLDDKLLVGYLELKAPGKGANPKKYKGHDREQWKRFSHIPNILYTDGNEWALYRDGKLEGKRVRIKGDVTKDGKNALNTENAKDLFHLLAVFTSWTPIVPGKPKELAAFLAPYCLLIREEVLDALKNANSPMHLLKEEIKNLLFPEASDNQFACRRT